MRYATVLLTVGLCLLVGCGKPRPRAVPKRHPAASAVPVVPLRPRVLAGKQAAACFRLDGANGLQRLVNGLTAYGLPAEIKSVADDFLRQTGLGKIDVEWISVTVGELENTVKDRRLPSLAVAIRGQNDLVSLTARLEQTIRQRKRDFAFMPCTVAGVAAWRLPKSARGPDDPDYHFASLDGKLILVTLSRDDLERQIRLFRQGQEESDTFPGVYLPDGYAVDAVVPSVPALRMALDGATGPLGRLRAFFDGFADLQTMDFKVATTGELRLTGQFGRHEAAVAARPVFASALSAVRTDPIVAAGLPSAAKALLTGLWIDTKDTETALAGRLPVGTQPTVFLSGAATGLLLPQVFAALDDARSTYLARQGQQIVRGLLAADAARAARGLPSLRPHLSATDGLSSDASDIAGKVYVTATEYFKRLFDLPHQKIAGWRPLVEGYEATWLTGGILAPGQPGHERPANVIWTIVAGLPEEAPGSAPLLLSSNIDTANFPTVGTLDGASTEPVHLVSHAPHGRILSGCQAVVITKDGSVRNLPVQGLTFGQLLGGESVTLPPGIEVRYLHP